MNRSAIFDETGAYRYALYRSWDAGRGTCLFIMLNPSTADDQKDDPTVSRCIKYAQRCGYKELVVANTFALRSTDPTKLYGHPDPIGPKNNWYLKHLAKTADKIVCAWGNHGAYMGRGDAVIKMLSGRELYAFEITSKGQPKHPLYQRADSSLFRLTN